MDSSTGQQILDVGCGYSKMPGAVCLDNNPLVHPDVLHNIESIPYPFDDNSFDLIHCGQILEHTSDIIPIMKELHRIAKPGGHLAITVPHFSGKTAFMDPSHKTFFAWNTFCYFTTDYFYTGARYEIIEQRLTFSRLFRIFGIAFLANRFPRFYEDYLKGVFPARNLCVTMQILK